MKFLFETVRNVFIIFVINQRKKILLKLSQIHFEVLHANMNKVGWVVELVGNPGRQGPDSMRIT